MFNLKEKIAIVTGARRGIGKAIALNLAKGEAKVVVTDINSDECDEVLEEIKEKGGNGIALKLDISDSDDVEEVIKTVIEKFGRIDILVNNAGILLAEDVANKPDLSIIDKTMNVNLKGLMSLTYAVLPFMVKQNYGKIVNISSIASMVGWPKIPSYSASKGGINGFTKGIAAEFASKGINVNAVLPGAIETPMLEEGLKEMGGSKEITIQMTPKGRLGQPEDIANAVRFLVSDEADFITGQLLISDGGYTII